MNGFFVVLVLVVGLGFLLHVVMVVVSVVSRRMCRIMCWFLGFRR